jgi:tetratricopeptide (TPR) repeat protein
MARMTAPGSHPRLQRAVRLFQAGNLRECEAECRGMLQVNPNDAEALNLLGALATRAGQAKPAIELITRAIQLSPSVAKYRTNRGEAFRALNELDRATEDYRAAISIDPKNAIAHYNLGLVLRAQGKLDEAVESYRAAVRVKPDYAKAHYNLANALRAQLRNDEAEASYREAIRLNPKYVEAHNNLGELLSEQMRLDEAFASFDRALSLRPDHAGAHFNRAFLRLLRGDYEHGWPEHEWRWKTAQQAHLVRDFFQPMWDGSDLAGKSILLHAEQGVGDTLHFVRYASLVAQRGAKEVIVECQAPVASLVATVPGVTRVIARGDELPPFDVHAPLLSLPMLFKTKVSNIPANIPYISPDAARLDAWRRKLSPMRRRFNVGVAWAGNPGQANDRNRSAPLSALKPLSGIEEVALFGLQVGPATAQITGSGLDLIDLSCDLHDFSETAAAVANLDAVVSVCTSVAHVAGALGKPTVTMLCHNADWRWLVEREDSPWYPTMKLVRQTRRGGWEDVARRVRTEIQQMLRSKQS